MSQTQTVLSLPIKPMSQGIIYMLACLLPTVYSQSLLKVLKVVEASFTTWVDNVPQDRYVFLVKRGVQMSEWCIALKSPD